MRKHVTEHKANGLGELAATAICGNDITSSSLYVSAFAIMAAGKWAPVSLLIVSGVLYLFRGVYAEVVGALPLNGGAYNALLNTTSKSRASIAACLTILSYMATAVISANFAVHYAHNVWSGIPVTAATVGLLALFMVLTIIGIGESSQVAIGIFITHMATLTLAVLAGGYFLLNNGTAILMANLTEPTDISVGHALFYGFAAAMLGISGFESSANFVEEQAEGVFPKTLRNMWVAVSVFNPLIALIALALVPIAEVPVHEKKLLAEMGSLAGGSWLATLVSIDAVLVLSGAVLTSFVGVNGLIHRMTLDRCLPQFLLKRNRRKTTHRIIIGFFLLTVSILFISGGDVKTLAGVYTISFLSVMVLFGVGNVLLKVYRSRLPRPERASWVTVLLAICGALVGLVGNLIENPDHFRVFLNYFVPSVVIVAIMLSRIAILKVCLFMVRRVTAVLASIVGGLSSSIRAKIEEINSQQIVFFTRGDNIANLNNAVLYVKNNEHTNRIKVVTVVDDEEELPPNFREDLEFLDKTYPSIDLELVVLVDEFGPELVRKLSHQWSIPTNLMFIGSPGDHFLYGLAELGGVRLII